jgi:hypothetical protein
VAEVVAGAVVLVTGATGALWAEVVGEVVEVVLLEPPQPARARAREMRMALAAVFIGAR